MAPNKIRTNCGYEQKNEGEICFDFHFLHEWSVTLVCDLKGSAPTGQPYYTTSYRREQKGTHDDHPHTLAKFNSLFLQWVSGLPRCQYVLDRGHVKGSIEKGICCISTQFLSKKPWWPEEPY